MKKLLSCLILCTTIHLFAQNTPYPFYDDFESGKDNWLSAWDTTSSKFSGALHSITDSPQGNYPPYCDKELVLKNPIDISDSDQPVLCFFQNYITQGNTDFCHIYFSMDGGMQWTEDTSYSGGHSGWHYLTIPLTQYKSKTLKVKFVLTSNSSAQYDGWYIDDLEIKELNIKKTSYPFKENFDKTLSNWLYSDQGWQLTDKKYSSSDKSITDSPDGKYSPYNYSEFVLKDCIDLTSAARPVLNFWQSHITQGDVDFCRLLFSMDGGITWVEDSSYSSGRQGWHYVTIPLSEYKSELFKVKFLLTSNGSAQYDGWYIDDIEITEFNTNLTAFPFSDDFENGLDKWLYSEQGWDTTGAEYFSENYSITDSRTGNYPPYDYSEFILKDCIDLSYSENPALSFWHEHFTQGGVDLCRVLFSTDGGLEWVQDTIFSGGNMGWRQEVIPISDYKSELFKVKFLLTSNSSAQYDGWYIDDVKILDYNPDGALLAYPLVIGFDSVEIDHSGKDSIVFKNVGADTLRLNRMYFSGGDSAQFEFDIVDFKVANEDSQKIEVRFVPVEQGIFSTQLVVNTTGGCEVISLTGTGYDDPNIIIKQNKLPVKYGLAQNFPNPFNPVTTIKYQLPVTSDVSLTIYNLLGQKVEKLVSAKQIAGEYRVKWDGSQFASGVYIYRLQAGTFIQTRKMILLR